MGGRRELNKPIVLLLAETGFIIRNLLLGYFADDVTRNCKLVVAVKVPNDPALTELCLKKGIDVIPFPIETYFDKRSDTQRFFSWDNIIYLFELSRKNNKSLEIQTRLFEGTQSTKVRIASKAVIMLSRLIRLAGLSSAIHNMYLKRYIAKKAVTQKWTEILINLKPNMVFTTMLTHSLRFRCSTDLPVAVAAHALNIKVCSLVQSWDNLSSKTSLLPAWVNPYFSWSGHMTGELLKFNPQLTRKNVIEVGSPQYDFHERSLEILRSEFLIPFRLDPARPYILIGTGTAKWMPDEPRKVINIIKALKIVMPEMQVLIRLHPKDDGKRWESALETLLDLKVGIQYSAPDRHMDLGGFVPPKDFYKQQINAVIHSVCVINSSSSLTVDAAILNKPSICIAYDLEPDPLFPQGRSYAFSKSTHYQSLVDTGGVWVVKSETECLDAIGHYYRNPDLHKDERQLIVKKVAGDSEQKSGKLLASLVYDLTIN